MKKRNIYQDRSQELFQLFEQAGSSSKVMCVPIDYAKKDHMVVFCNGCGAIVRKPFRVKNSPEGFAYLIDQTARSCRQRHIQKQHVFFGGEDVNSYAENFVNALRSDGWRVANVNAHDAKKQRENLQASTDRLDLMGIATLLLNCRANCCPPQSGRSLNNGAAVGVDAVPSRSLCGKRLSRCIQPFRSAAYPKPRVSTTPGSSITSMDNRRILPYRQRPLLSSWGWPAPYLPVECTVEMQHRNGSMTVQVAGSRDLMKLARLFWSRT